MELRRSPVVLSLVGLVLLDLILIAWALWPRSVAGAGQTPDPAATAPAEVTTTETPVPTTAEPPPTAAPGNPVPLVRLVTAASPTTVWLVDAGTCDQPGQVHVTTTGGDEWVTRPAPGSVTRLRVTDVSAAFVVGGDADCAARVWYTADSGETWGAAQSAADAWGRDPDNPQLVLRPGGEPVQPCLGGAVLDLVGLTGGAATALCADGNIRTSTDSGATWTTTAARDGLLAVSVVSVGEGAAVGLEADCAGVTVAPLAGGSLGESVCVEDVSYAPGQVAISVTEGAVWLVAGDDVLRADAIGSPFAPVSQWPGA